MLFCCVVVCCCCAQPLKTQTLNLAWERPALRGPTCSGFDRCCGCSCCGCCWFGLPWTTFRRTPPPLDRTAQNFALFLPFPATVSLFLCLSGCLLVEFWWCFEGRNLEMCTSGLSGCRVKPRRPHQTGPPGHTRQPENSKRAHLSVPALDLGQFDLGQRVYSS